MAADGLLDCLPFGASFFGGARVGFALQVRKLFLHLFEIGQAGRVNGGRSDCAAGLSRVRAVAEAAALGQLLNVVKTGIEIFSWLLGVGPELDFAQAGQSMSSQPPGMTNNWRVVVV